MFRVDSAPWHAQLRFGRLVTSGSLHIGSSPPPRASRLTFSEATSHVTGSMCSDVGHGSLACMHMHTFFGSSRTHCVDWRRSPLPSGLRLLCCARCSYMHLAQQRSVFGVLGRTPPSRVDCGCMVVGSIRARCPPPIRNR